MLRLLVLLSILSFAPACLAQSFVGIEGGIGMHNQEGTFLCDCGGSFTGGTGTGLTWAAFYEMALGSEFSAGIKVGIDFKNTTSDATIFEVVRVEPRNQGRFDTIEVPMDRTGVTAMTRLQLSPYVQYKFFHTAFFAQLGLGVSSILNSRFTQNRTMLVNSVTLDDGTQVNNVTFPDGTRSETIQEGPVTNVHSILFSGIASIGYGISVGKSVLSPMITYDLPLSNIQTNSNWRIGSVYGSVELKFKL